VLLTLGLTMDTADWPLLGDALTERVKPVRHNDARNIRRGATLSARFGQDGHPFRAPKRACAGGPAIPGLHEHDGVFEAYVDLEKK
jgi:hypothetical protein